MGERAAHERNVLHAGEAKVGDELAAAAHQAIVFLAEKARANALLFHRDPLPRGNRIAFVAARFRRPLGLWRRLAGAHYPIILILG